MDKNDTGTGGISESELVKLLTSLKVEPAPEIDFEARFLYDLRERLARESVCCSARRLLWDHILQMLSNFGPRKLVYSASTLGLGAIVAGVFAFDEPDSAAASVAKSTQTLLERSIDSLRANDGQEAQSCTSIHICEQEKQPYTEVGLASGVFSSIFGQGTAAGVSTKPVNMGIESSAMDSFPTYSTAVGF